MAPQSRTQRMLGKSSFAPYFSKLKTITYSDAPPSTSSRPPTTIASHSIKTIAWSPLGNFIATGAGDRTLRIWNPEKNQVKNSTELKGHESGIERVAWNPTKEAELASFSSDGVVKFWDVRSRDVIWETKVEDGGLTLAWRPDGQDIVLGTKQDLLIPISRATRSVLGSYKQNVQTNQTIFSYGGNELFATTGDGQVKIFDYPSMTLIHTMNAHTSSCVALDMSPSGLYLAVAGSDALITLWDTTDLICIRTFAEMSDPPRSISFSFDGSYIVGNTLEDRTLEIAHVETGEYVHTVKTGTHGGNGCVAWAPRSYMLAYAGENPQALRIIGGLGGAV